MVAIVLPTRWQEQPQYPVELDWGHPLTLGLVLSVPLSHDRLQYDRGGQSLSNITGTKERRIQGVEARGFFSTLGVGTTDSVNTGYTENHTFNTWVIWFWRNGLGGNNLGRLFDKGTAAGTSGYRAFGNNAVLDVSVSTSGTAGSYRITNPSGSVWHQYVWSINLTSAATMNSSRTMYVDASSQSVVDVAAATGTYNEPTETLLIGNRQDAARGWDGYHRDFLHYNRILNAAEVAELYRNPYQIYRKRSARIYALPTAGPSFNPAWAKGSNVILGVA